MPSDAHNHIPAQNTQSQAHHNNHVPNLNPLANLIVPLPPTAQSASVPPPPRVSSHVAPPPPNIISCTTARPKAPVRKNKPAQPPQNLDLEYAKIELNTAQATINVLETTVNDLRFRNGILEDRVKQLEEMKKTEIFDKYFPPQQQKPQSREHCSQPAFSHQCCHHLPQCSHHHAQQSQPDTRSLENMQSAISSLKAEVEVIKSKLDLISLVGHHSVNQHATQYSGAAHRGSDARPDPDRAPHPPHHAAQLSPGADNPVPEHGSPEQHPETEQIQNSTFLSCEQEMAEFDSEDPLNCE